VEGQQTPRRRYNSALSLPLSHGSSLPIAHHRTCRDGTHARRPTLRRRVGKRHALGLWHLSVANQLRQERRCVSLIHHRMRALWARECSAD
jgi:hypothetical protein